MNAPTTFKPTLEQVARDILAGNWHNLPDADYSIIADGDWEYAAQLYIDNLADGYNEPNELNELLAMCLAASELPQGAPCKDGSFLEGPYSTDDWFDRHDDHYKARAAESYAPAIGGVL